MSMIKAIADKAETAEAHWFASSVLHWRVGYDLAEVLADLRKANRSSSRTKRNDPHADVVIYRVPGPTDAAYKINNYAPQVEGAECVGHADLRFEN